MFRKLAHSLGLSSAEPPKAVVAQMGRNSYRVAFEDSDYEDAAKGVKVGFLRNKVAELANHPVDNITMVYSGRKLVDDDMFLVDYGVPTDGKVLVLSTKARPKIPKPSTANRQPAPKPAKPLSPREQIDKVMNPVDETFEKPLQKFIDTPAKDLEKLTDEHRRLSEGVLQQILKLDDVDVSSDSEMRQYRKDSINRLHKLHERIDKAFEQKKSDLQEETSDSKENSNQDA
uniref:ARAD1C27038p n=1 Tax=Blastobotrys adeninivorans TaxID=409370 RepID=A0A060T1T9_BLAAD